MSWLDKITNVSVEIKCGDGRVYKPLWKQAKRNKKFNTSSYNFINKAGTLIDRQQPEGYQYDLIIHFQGEDHLDVAEAFNNSADDPRFWTIKHPYYNEIYVQPLSLGQNNDVENITTFNIKLWETIATNVPAELQVAEDIIEEGRINTNEESAGNFSNVFPELSTGLRAVSLESLTRIDDVVSASITDNDAFAEFKTLVSDTKRQINDSLNPTIDTMRSLIATINYPIVSIQSVQNRFRVLNELRTQLTQVILGITGADYEEYNLYETVFSSIIAAMGNSAITPGPEDYIIRTDVVNVSDELRSAYEDYLQTLDGIQASRSDIEKTFTPDNYQQTTLNNVIDDTLANLFLQAFNAKQERVILLERESNPIRLTHRFYSLDESDDNLQFFIDTNGLSLDELFEIKKGRKIVYYL